MNVKQFLDWSKANPDAAVFGSPGVGSTMHYLGALLAKAGGAPLRHLPYRGSAQSIADTLGGQIAPVISTAPILVPHHQSGRLKVLATSGR
jgi:tripartite-type tricarboxylate transporter receptor subunit TctC